MEEENPFNAAQIYTGDKAYQAEAIDGSLVPMAPPMPMIQSKTAYHTAVSVQRPRDLDKVVAAVKREAILAGEAFYWSWPVKAKNKETGKYDTKILSGASIGLSMCVAREWTNVAIPIDYMETATHDIFTAHFVDLERGFTVSRIWKQSKKANKDLDSYGDRAVNMTFQAAQSRAIRNVVLAGVPKWLVEQAKGIAMQSVLDGITPEKIIAARDTIIKIFAERGIGEARLVAAIGIPVSQWAPEQIVLLKGMSTQIREGTVAAEELFPPIEEKAHDKKATTKPKAPLAAEKATEPQWSPEGGAGEPSDSGAPTVDELLAKIDRDEWPDKKLEVKFGKPKDQWDKSELSQIADLAGG